MHILPISHPTTALRIMRGPCPCLCVSVLDLNIMHAKIYVASTKTANSTDVLSNAAQVTTIQGSSDNDSNSRAHMIAHAANNSRHANTYYANAHDLAPTTTSFRKPPPTSSYRIYWAQKREFSPLPNSSSCPAHSLSESCEYPYQVDQGLLAQPA